MAANDNVSIDLSNYKDKVGSRVTPGRYRVVVEDTEIDKSSAGNVMINLWLRVVGGEFDGATIIDRLVQSEKSLFRTVNFLQALGFPTPKKKLTVQPKTWVGRQLDIDVTDGEPYNGRVKSEVRGYEKAPKAAAPAEPVDEFAQTIAGTGEDDGEAVDVTPVQDEVDLENLNL